MQEFLDSYRSQFPDYDEFVDADGQIRPAWSAFARKVGSFNSEEVSGRNDLLRRLIEDNGITYNVYSEEENSREWTMDLFPLIFGETEWNDLERKLQQRAELINEVLADLYGPQHCLQEAILPPYLAYANPAFLRSCYNIKPIDGQFVQLYAADIARSPDGSWWVLNDRVEAASGMGYVMENRMLSNRVFPELFRDQSVMRLKPFYDQVAHSFASLNPTGEADRQVAMLTPGPANETYFEQSYLCKNLGFLLVEGADLTVRENRLFFKSLNNIRPIDTLIRRLDSEWCDPLELRNESLLGVPGLVNCLRSQNLALVNMIGTGLMETVAIPAFMNALCQYFRGEELQIPSVATWWCGQPKEFDYVSENLNKLVIKRTFRRRYDQAIFGPNLDDDQTRETLKMLQKSPEDYCAQELVSHATAPVFHEGGLEPRHFLVRVYLLRINGTFRLLPGGFARHAPTPEGKSVSMQHGAVSKDVWVLREASGSVPEFWSDRPSQQEELQPIEDEVSSRTANNMYWLGRYIERIELLARQLRIIMLAITEDFHEDSLDVTRSFIGMLLMESEFDEIFEQKSLLEKVNKLDLKLQKYVWDSKYMPSLLSGFNQVRRIAFNIKDRLSNDTWQILDSMKDFALTPSAGQPDIIHEQSIEALEETIDWLAAFNGMTTENMTQSYAWHFMMIGKRLERAHNILETVRHSVVENPDQSEEHLRWMLEYSDSVISYRNRYLNRLDKSAVARVLLKDPQNPRSLSFNVGRLLYNLNALPWGNEVSEHSGTTQRLRSDLIEAQSRLDNRLIFDGQLESMIAPLESVMNQLQSTIEQRFFSQI